MISHREKKIAKKKNGLKLNRQRATPLKRTHRHTQKKLRKNEGYEEGNFDIISVWNKSGIFRETKKIYLLINFDFL